MKRSIKNIKTVISIEEDEALPDRYGLERFMEEINILELEGVYFCPSRNETRKRAQGAISLTDISERPITIAFTNHGQPGETAYRVLQAVFFKLSEAGKDTDGTVLFSQRELARLIGMSFGGRQAAKLYNAIKQLQRTDISCSIRFKVRKNNGWEKKWRSVSFTIFGPLAFEGSERGRFTRCLIKVDDRIVENFKNRHVSYFNFERMRTLDMVGMMLYKRFFRHFANIYREGMDRNALKFEKDYEQLCSSWLGLRPMSHRSRIEQQLGKHLEALKSARLLRAWSIEPRADGAGFKVVGYAGAGFFKDYQDIY
jgi:Replication initiator protein A